MTRIRSFCSALLSLLLFPAVTPADQIYWNASGAGIVQANLDGTDFGTFRLEPVHGVAVDPNARRIYWNNPVDNTLRSARLDGADVQTLSTNAGSGDIAIDLLQGKIYWNGSGAGILRANLDGTQRETFRLEPVAGLAVDPFASRIYWNNPVDNTLRWAMLDGTGVETLITNVGTGDMALDLINGKIYWNASGSGILRANLDGSQHTTFRLEPVHGIAVDPVRDRIYWNNPIDNTLRWSMLDGSGVATIVNNAGTGAMALDVAFIPEPAGAFLVGFLKATICSRIRRPRPPAAN